jgi:hypothetical protein
VDAWAGHRGAITPSGGESGRGPAWGFCGRRGAIETSAATVGPMGRCNAEARAAAHLHMMRYRPLPPRVAAARLKGMEAWWPSSPDARPPRDGHVEAGAAPRRQDGSEASGGRPRDHPPPPQGWPRRPGNLPPLCRGADYLTAISTGDGDHTEPGLADVGRHELPACMPRLRRSPGHGAPPMRQHVSNLSPLVPGANVISRPGLSRGQA